MSKNCRHHRVQRPRFPIRGQNFGDMISG